MSLSQKVVPGVLVATAGVLVVVAAVQFRERKHVVDETVAQIEDQVAALDPVTRAAVIARLAEDAAHAVPGQH